MMSANCSEALRMIGHDLELRGIKTFLIRCDADVFVVEGGYQSPPAITPVSLQYASDDIDQLKRESRKMGDHVSAGTDFSSLSQILWAIGIYANIKGFRLLSISNTESTETMPLIKLEYETVHSDRVVEDLTGSAIYELCVSGHRMRVASDIKNSRRYTRFSSLQESS